MEENIPNKNLQKILLPKGFAGTGPNGSFFETPEWVDKSKGNRHALKNMTSSHKILALIKFFPSSKTNISQIHRVFSRQVL